MATDDVTQLLGSVPTTLKFYPSKKIIRTFLVAAIKLYEVPGYHSLLVPLTQKYLLIFVSKNLRKRNIEAGLIEILTKTFTSTFF